MSVSKDKISFTELADLCHELNTLTNRQYRPGHQLVKLFNSLSQFSRSGEFYKNEDQVLRLFSTYNPEYKQNHPHIVNQLAKFIVMPELEKKEALQNFAKQLDEHEQWEWESRRKAKTRRKQHHGKSPGMHFADSPAFAPVSGMNSLSRPSSSTMLSSMSSTNTLSSMASTNTLSSMSSEEPEDMGFYSREFDPVPWKEDRYQHFCEAEQYYPEDNYHGPARYRRDFYRDPARHHPQYRRELPYKQEWERAPRAGGKSFEATNRHISAQLHDAQRDLEYDSVLNDYDRWEWDDEHYSELVSRLYDDDHLSPYVPY